MTFTANAGIVVGERFIPANFRFPERQLEEARFTRWFETHGYRIETVHEPHYWEGRAMCCPGKARCSRATASARNSARSTT